MLTAEQLAGLAKPKGPKGTGVDREYCTISKEKVDTVRKYFAPMAKAWNCEVSTAMRIVIENLADGNLTIDVAKK